MNKARVFAVGVGVALSSLVPAVAHAEGSEPTGMTGSVEYDSPNNKGFEQIECTSDQAAKAIHILTDSLDAPDQDAVCVLPTGTVGWWALKVKGSYGVYNRSDVSVSVGVTNSSNGGFWQRTVEKGQRENVQASGDTTVVIELMYGDKSKLSPKDSTLTIGNSVSLYDPAGRRYLYQSYSRASGREIGASSRLGMRVQSSFRVTPALNGDAACVSLEMASARGLYLTADSEGLVGWKSGAEAIPGRSSWCPTGGGSSVGLRLADDLGARLAPSALWDVSSDYRMVGGSSYEWHVKTAWAVVPAAG